MGIHKVGRRGTLIQKLENAKKASMQANGTYIPMQSRQGSPTNVCSHKQELIRPAIVTSKKINNENQFSLESFKQNRPQTAMGTRTPLTRSSINQQKPAVEI